jgi:CRP-like cAMP-binding protein
MEKSPNFNLPRITCDDPRLAKFQLFSGFTKDEVDALLLHSDTVAYREGDTILTAGESGHTMYLILEGRVRVSATQGGQRVELAELRAGDFFGELALVDDGPRSADVEAVADCELLRITRMTLGLLAGLQPGAAIQLLAAIGRSLVERLRAGNQRYMDLILLGHSQSA